MKKKVDYDQVIKKAKSLKEESRSLLSQATSLKNQGSQISSIWKSPAGDAFTRFIDEKAKYLQNESRILANMAEALIRCAQEEKNLEKQLAQEASQKH